MAPTGLGRPRGRALEDERLRRERDLPAGPRPRGARVPADGARAAAACGRVRYLRRARELLLRDLGGFVYEVHRTAGGHQHGGHREILERKAGRLAAPDAELRELEARLGARAPQTVVREPGIGGTCPTLRRAARQRRGFCAPAARR